MADAHVISVVNMKGGVGKTTISVALAEALAVMAKKKVLVIDLDAQASCTFALAGEAGFSEIQAKKKHTYRLFKAFYGALDEKTVVNDLDTSREGREIARTFLSFSKRRPDLAEDERPVKTRDLIYRDASFVENAKRLHLIGSIPELQVIERDILYRLGRMTQTQTSAEGLVARYLKDRLDEVKPLYDVIIIDCPPGISALTESAVRASRTVLAPVMPEFLSYMGLNAFVTRVIRRLRREGHFTGNAFALLNRVQALPGHDEFRDTITELADSMGDDLHMFPMEIEQAPELARAVEPPKGDRPVPIREKYGNAVPTLDDLANHVLDVTENAISGRKQKGHVDA